MNAWISETAVSRILYKIHVTCKSIHYPFIHADSFFTNDNREKFSCGLYAVLYQTGFLHRTLCRWTLSQWDFYSKHPNQ